MPRRERVGYALQPFEERLSELEAKGAREPRHLAFAATVGGVRTHQYYFDRFWKLTGATCHDLLQYADVVSDGNRAAAHNYLTHGLHSYKGKFFPQIVRALLNYGDLHAGSSVVDPFVGSGTTTVEATLMGHDAHGIDKNPLAALIAETKMTSLTLDAGGLADAAREVRERIASSRARECPNGGYLARWFPAETLIVIARALAGIEAADVPKPFKDVARLILSTNLRAWSLQEPSQLRIFRRAEAPEAGSLLLKFESDLNRAVLDVHTSIQLLGQLGLTLGGGRIVSGDARGDDAWGTKPYDALVTSPPYATALPYIDTDRLSLFALGLVDVSERNDLEWAMIGNREIRKRQKLELETALASNAANLPEEICGSIQRIKRANDASEVGFRRANLPALLYKYFWDMDTVLARASERLRHGALCAIVVGDSYTVAGATRVRIETGSHLVASAESHGFRLEERIPMGGQSRYLPHQRNTIPDEEIIVLRLYA